MSKFKSNLTYFAESNYYCKHVLISMKQEDRLMHTYIIGKTGTGKSTLLQTFMIQDLLFGRGVCVFDIHGDLINKIYPYIPRERLKDVVYLDITDNKQLYHFNPFIKVPYEERQLIASGILDVFEKLWKSAWGVKLEHILRYILLTLLDQEKSYMSDIIRIMEDDEFRKDCLKNVINDEIKGFWENEFKNYTKGDLLPIYNKIGAFLVYPSVKRLLIENTKEISFRDIMDKKKILLVNISKGSLGENVSGLLGSLLLNAISFAAFTRVDTIESNRTPFFVYLDEFQNYTTPTLINMLSELRKFRIGLIMAHQYLSQLTDEIRDAVLGNTGTLISFRLGVSDATYFAKEFYPVFDVQDLVNLSNYEIYLKLMIDGTPSAPFNAKTIKWTE